MEFLNKLLACCTTRTPGTAGVVDAGPDASSGSTYPACSLEACGCTPNYESPFPPRTAYTIRETRLWTEAAKEQEATSGSLRREPRADRVSAAATTPVGEYLPLDAHTRGFDFVAVSHRDRGMGGPHQHWGTESLSLAEDHEVHRAHFSRHSRGLREGSSDSDEWGRERGGFLREQAGERRGGAYVSLAPRGLFDPLGLPARGGGNANNANKSPALLGAYDSSSSSSKSPLSDAETQVPREKSPCPSVLSDETLSTRSHETSVCSIASTDVWTEEGLTAGMAPVVRPRYAEAHKREHKKKKVYA